MPRLCVALLLLSACSDWDDDLLSNGEERALGLNPREADTDFDGLGDAVELQLGTDPSRADTDGDSLLDGAEHLDLGTDPLAADSDHDGYRDPDELAEGTDPANARSKIYQGGWPYYPDKASIEAGSDALAFGERMQRFTLTDQYGEDVDLYDLYGSGPVVVTVSPMYCPWVWELAAYLSGAPYNEGGYVESSLWPAGPEVVARGDVRWVVVVPSNLALEPPTPDDLTEVAEALGAANSPVLSDGDFDFTDYTGATFFPFTFVLDEGLVVQDPSVSGHGGEATLGDTTPVLAHLAKLFPE